MCKENPSLSGAPVWPKREEDGAFTLVQACNVLRGVCGHVEKDVRALIQHPDIDKLDREFQGEARANVMLAVRHLEDARMRLGKVIQHAESRGVSCYDQKKEG